MDKQPVVVHIAGQRYVVRTDADEAYVQSLAGFVNDQIVDIQKTSKPVSLQSVAILAALNIADDLFRERQKRSELKSKIRDKSKAIIAYLDKEAKASFQNHK